MDDLKKIVSNLEKINKENPFTVPDRYFENFSGRLTDNIHAKIKESGKGRHAFALRPYLAAAVILIAVLLAGNYVFRNNQSKKADERFQAEVSRVVDQELYSISEETILEVLNVDVPADKAGKTVSSDEAIDYLMQENLSNEELIIAL